MLVLTLPPHKDTLLKALDTFAITGAGTKEEDGSSFAMAVQVVAGISISEHPELLFSQQLDLIRAEATESQPTNTPRKG